MAKKASKKAKARKSGTLRGAPSKSAKTTTQRSGSLNQKNSKTFIGRNSVIGEFVSAKTGRIIKSSPAKPNLGREIIQTAVRSYIHREGRT